MKIVQYHTNANSVLFTNADVPPDTESSSSTTMATSLSVTKETPIATDKHVAKIRVDQRQGRYRIYNIRNRKMTEGDRNTEMVQSYETHTAVNDSEQDRGANNKKTSRTNSKDMISPVIGDSQLVLKQTNFELLNKTSVVENPVSGAFGEYQDEREVAGKPEMLPAILVEKKGKMTYADVSEVNSATPEPCDVTAKNTDSLPLTIAPRVRVSLLNKYTDNRGLKTGRCIEVTKGLCKEKKSKNPRLLWKWVGGSRSLGIFCFVGNPSQNNPKPVGLLIFWSSIPCVFCLHIPVHC